MIRRLGFAAALILAGCTHSIHHVHVSDFEPYRADSQGEVVEAYAEQFVVMFFAFDTNYVDQAYVDMQTKCVRGRITGITTQYSTSHGFFSWTNKVRVKGLCSVN